MGAIRPGPVVKLFVAALIAQDGRDKIKQFDRVLIDKFGAIDLVSPTWPFEFTDYYTAEMGPDLIRRIVSFESLFDPGYLSLGQIVLATTKSYSHRIYLRDGVWAEVTLRYHKGRYEKLEWSYPDYACGRYNDFWLEMRAKLKHQLQEQSSRNERRR